MSLKGRVSKGFIHAKAFNKRVFSNSYDLVKHTYRAEIVCMCDRKKNTVQREFYVCKNPCEDFGYISFGGIRACELFFEYVSVYFMENKMCLIFLCELWFKWEIRVHLILVLL